MKRQFLLSLLLCVLLVCSLIPNVYAQVFTDDFELGNGYGGWTGTTNAGTGTVAASSALKHHNTNSSYSFSTASGDTGYARKTVDSTDILYIRAYVYFDSYSLDAKGKYIYVLGLDNGDHAYASYVRVRKNYVGAGTDMWGIAQTENYAITWIEGTHTPVADTWYCIELLRDVTNNNQTLWIDGVQECTSSNAITTNMVRAVAGTEYTTSVDDINLYSDCVVIDTSYIGLEGAGGPTAYVVDLTKTFTIALSKATQTNYHLVTTQAITTTLNLYTIGNYYVTLTETINPTFLFNAATNYNVILDSAITTNLLFTALTSYNVILSQGTTIGLTQYAALVYYVTLSLSANLAMIQYFQTAFHVILTHGINPTLTPFIHTAFNVVLQSTWTTGLISYAINATAVFNHFIVDLALNIATVLLNPIEIATTIASAFALAGLALIIALSAFGAIFLVRRKQN